VAITKRTWTVKQERKNKKTGKVTVCEVEKTAWTVSVFVPSADGSPAVRHTIGTFPRKTGPGSAERAEEEAKLQIRMGTFVPPRERKPTAPPPTVADALDIWYQTKRGTVTTNTAAIYEVAIRKHLVPALGSVELAALTHDAVQRQVNAWRDDGKMGARLLARCVAVLRAALARQVRNGTIPFNPADGVEKPSARTKKELPIWTNKQMDAFLALAAKDQYHAPFWFFCLCEGMRRGEALAVRWCDLVWGAGELTCTAIIAQTIVPDLANGGRAMVQQRAKTKGSQRSIVLTAPTIAILKAHRDRQRFHRQKLGELWGDHDLICTTSVGTPITPSSIKRDMAALVKAAKLPPVSVHGLRHICATTMLKAGVSPALAALKLGHSDIGTTVDRYGHLAVSDQAAANAALEAAMRGNGTEG